TGVQTCALPISDVRLRRISSEGKMRAIASITINDAFVVHDVRIIDGNNGLFVAMPSKRTAEGEFKDIAHPINSETREIIQTAVIKEYENRDKTGENLESREEVIV